MKKMFSWIRALCFVLTLMMLSACEAQESGDLKTYLMQHPQVLRNEMLSCEAKSPTTPRCEVVMKAVSDMRVLIEEQQKDPQAFGQRILHAQMQQARTGQDADEVKILQAVVGMNGSE